MIPNRRVIGLLSMGMAMSAMAASGMGPIGQGQTREREDKSFLRKKCKSCSLLHDCQIHRYRIRANHQACKQYKPKNK